MNVAGRPIHLDVEQVEIADSTRRTMRLHGLGATQAEPVEIVFDLLDEAGVPEPYLLGGFVLGVIFFAMEQGRPLHVRGRLSRQFLRNIHEFQSIWTTWRPERYRQIEIVPDEVVEDLREAGPDSAIATFSGGVDGFFISP